MIWFKAWREAKPRFALGLLFIVAMGIANVVMVQFVPPQATYRSAPGVARTASWDILLGGVPPVAAGPDHDAQIAWRAYLNFALFLVPMLGIMMAGSGIFSRLAYGLKEETHPSMIYTLALPVPRRRWLEVRAGLGLALTIVLAVAMLAIPPLSALFTHQPFSWAWPLRAAPFLLLGTTVFYLFAVLLEVLGNENWRLGSMAALLYCVVAQIAFGSRLRLFPFLAGYDASVAGIMVCVVLSVAFYASALAAFERREF